jgi:hypothetical protein
MYHMRKASREFFNRRLRGCRGLIPAIVRVVGFVGQARRLLNQFNPAGGSACPTSSDCSIRTAQCRVDPGEQAAGQPCPANTEVNIQMLHMKHSNVKSTTTLAASDRRGDLQHPTKLFSVAVPVEELTKLISKIHFGQLSDRKDFLPRPAKGKILSAVERVRNSLRNSKLTHEVIDRSSSIQFKFPFADFV